MTTETESESTLEAQEALLYSARHGEINVVRDLIKAQKDGTITLDISCKGKSKSNFGWTPLHLSTYFGHPDVVEVLLMEGADIDAANDIGDTALHKASFIGHEELVVMLLKYGADITLMNGEGKVPRDMAKTLDIRKLLLATEHTEQREREKKLVSAAREGDLNTINKLLTSPQPPNINCVDSQGNTSLHCAAYRGHAQVAVILLQNGIDSSLRNCNGKLAVDLARDSQMRDVLSVRPVRQLQRNAVRFEGQLLRRSRFLGWRPCWAVLQRGVLWYYSNRAEATSASGSEAQRQSNNNPLGKVNVVRRREYKYLDGAKVTAPVTDKAVLIINFSDGDTHRLAIPPTSDSADALAARQAWITAYNEHIAYSSHYLWAGSYGIPPPKGREATEMADCSVADDDEDESKPLGSMRDALTSAANGLALMESQLNDCEVIVTALNKDIQMGSTLQQSAFMRFQHAANTGQKALGALKHCVALVTQAKDSAEAKLECEVERRRVLEEALAALAREHHDLERSYAEEVSGRKRTKKPKQDKRFGSDDEFYDTFDADSDSDTLVTAGLSSPLGALSPWEVTPQGSPNESPNKTPTNPASPNFVASNSDTFSPPLQSTDSMQSISVLSPASSCGTLISQGGNVYRDARDDSIRMLHTPRKSLPVQQFSRNDFSLWSVLKNCVGKELSKITMPVVFNEPLSFLQRMLEYLEYAHLLRLASEQEDPMARMEYVAGFAVSALASNWERLGKPFNPLLGETYELQRPEFRAVCEQVSHHPPVSAFHADSPHFVFHGSVHPKLKFWGKSVEIQPKGHVTVELPRWGEAYTWCNVNCCVHNVIVGRLWMEQHGGMEVVRHGGGAGAGLRAQLAFKPAGWAGRDLHRVEGFILNGSKKKVKHLYGKWTEFIKCCPMNAYEEYMRERKSNGDSESSGAGSSDGNNSSPAKTPRKVLAKLNSLKVGALRSMSMQETEEAPPELPDGEIPKSESTYSIDIPNSVTIWEAKARPPNSSDYYQFTEFAMSLNELESTHSLAGAAGGRAGLCPTDSRLRPDIRRLESGDIDGAALEKARLEEKQRVVRKRGRRPGAPPFAARWFSQGTNPYTRQEDWLYNGGYWDRNYQHLADIDIF